MSSQTPNPEAISQPWLAFFRRVRQLADALDSAPTPPPASPGPFRPPAPAPGHAE